MAQCDPRFVGVSNQTSVGVLSYGVWFVIYSAYGVGHERPQLR
jgi:hypothetical protein